MTYQPFQPSPAFRLIVGDRRRVGFTYKNYNDVISKRTVYPKRVWFGTTPYHVEPQWIMDAYDLDKKADRSFAMRDMTDVLFEFEET